MHLLYSKNALDLLNDAKTAIQQKIEADERNHQYAEPGRIYHFEDETSSDEEEKSSGESDSQSESDGEDQSDSRLRNGDDDSRHAQSDTAIDGNGNSKADIASEVATSATKNDPSKITKKTPITAPQSKNAKKQKQQKKKHMSENRQLIRQQLFASNNAAVFPVDDDNEVVLPLSLLPKSLRNPGVGIENQCSNLQALANSLQSQNVVVLLVRSGRFAGGVFKGEKCIVHRAFQRYTIRKGQGKAQSAQDNSKRKANSMGAQLRRAGEISLREDIHETILQWKSHIASACLVLLSCPKTMMGSVFADAVKDVITRDDERIRKVPFDIGRPTFEGVCVSHDVMMHIAQRTIKQHDASTAQDADIVSSKQSANESAIASHSLAGVPPSIKEAKEDYVEVPLTPLHEAARNGDVEQLKQWLAVSSFSNEIDVQAGPDFSTPLHFAAELADDDAVKGAECVMALLVDGKADPCILDVRGRPPYFLATHDKVRAAFRIARGTLGEGHCDWAGAKVGPALTEEDMQAKKDKEAEKRRQKRARQKKKKMEDKAKEEAAQKALKEAEGKKKVNMSSLGDGNRVGCHWCNGDISRKPRKSLFFLHEFKFCSPDCVKNHKRAQAADAAMARLGL